MKFERAPRLVAALLHLLVLCLPACGGGAIGSIGAVLARDGETGAVHVRETPEGNAAAVAGLLPGDQLKMIDGVLCDGLTTEQIQALLRGEVGSTVRLTIVRGEEVLHVELVRQGMQRLAPPPPREELIQP
jgi:carboxyl-terminal processing protease